MYVILATGCRRNPPPKKKAHWEKGSINCVYCCVFVSFFTPQQLTKIKDSTMHIIDFGFQNSKELCGVIKRLEPGGRTGYPSLLPPTNGQESVYK